MWTPISKQAIKLLTFGFVDDYNLCINSKPEDQSIEDLVSRSQAVLTTWNEGLQATGGTLDPHKSFWWLLQPEWKNGEWKLKIRDEESEPVEHITLPDPATNEPVTVKRLECNESETALGINSRPDGSMKDQKKCLRDKADAWADQQRCLHMKAEDANYCFNSTIMKSLEYIALAPPHLIRLTVTTSWHQLSKQL